MSVKNYMKREGECVERECLEKKSLAKERDQRNEVRKRAAFDIAST